MAWNYGRYIDRVAGAGKAEYPIPMYVNAWLFGFGRPNQPGRTPSGGPLPHVMDLWKAGGPQIDMLSPDLYNDFAPFAALYTRSGNPLFIPEANAGRGGAARALYAFGRYNAIGFSPFGIERTMANDPDFAGIYDLLSQLAPLILEHQGKGSMSAVLLNPKDPPQKIQLGDYTFEAALTGPRAIPGAPRAPQNQPSGAIFIQTGPNEFLAIGIGLNVTFSPNTPGPEYAGLGTVEEGKFVNGRWVPRLKPGGDDIGPMEYLEFQNMSLQRFTLYRYR
jgi:hypothetical protein